MSKIRIDTYYDITCQHCARSRSTDFEMGMLTSKSLLSKMAYEEGWKYIHSMTLCPECAKSYYIAEWESVENADIPINRNWSGINSRTENKYWVMTQDGYVVEGYIYENQYSETNFAVWCGGDTYYNNVTHWAPNGLPIQKGSEA